MLNFEFQNPTKLIFGKGSIAKIADQFERRTKIMLTFGGGSVKNNGVYDQVIEALKDHDIVEFWGIEPNPKVETLRKAVALGKAENVEFIIAVGGGYPRRHKAHRLCHTLRRRRLGFGSRQFEIENGTPHCVGNDNACHRLRNEPRRSNIVHRNEGEIRLLFLLSQILHP